MLVTIIYSEDSFLALASVEIHHNCLGFLEHREFDTEQKGVG